MAKEKKFITCDGNAAAALDPDGYWLEILP